MKLLIITYNFPPLNVISSHRFNELSCFLRDHGITSWILTTHSIGTLVSKVPEENIIRIGFNHKNNEKSQEIHGWIGLLRNIVMKLKCRSKIFDYSLRWYWAVQRSLKQYAPIFSQMDFIIGSYGPAAPFFIANDISRKFKIPWIADYRDLCSLGQLHYSNQLLSYFDRLMEEKLIRNTVGLLTISNHLASILYSFFHKCSYVIYNGWNQSDLHDDTAPLHDRLNQNGQYLFYGGTINENRIPSILMVLNAMRMHPDLFIKLRSLGPRKSESIILNFANKNHLSKNIQILPPVSHQQSIKEARHSFCNLVLEDISPKFDYQKGILTGKFLKLLPLPSPVMAVACPGSEIGGILEDTGKGCLCSNEEEILHFLNQIKNHSSRYVGISERVRCYSLRSQAEKLACILSELKSISEQQ